MIEFVLKNRKLRLHPDGVLYSRALNNKGEETKKELWREVKYSTTADGYHSGSITLEGKARNVKIHRLIWFAYHQDWDIFDTSTNNFIDHINQDRKDNRIENLRIVSNMENCWNTSHGKGFYFDKRRGTYDVKIMKNGKITYVGQFKTEEEAVTAYKKAKEELHVITGNR